MKIPLSWIKEYVTTELSAKEIAHRLTMAGVETTADDPHEHQWHGVVVGHVTNIAPHPHADKLRLVTVNIESTHETVVCGAPNVSSGQKIAFAKEGAQLIHPQTKKLTLLKAVKIRGIMSCGMVCSDLELGLGNDHEGIKVLSDDAPVGALLRNYLSDPILEVETTPNRPDCLSVLGISRELAAIINTTLRVPKLTESIRNQKISFLDNITVADRSNCLRYTAALIKNVAVGPSPDWMQERLLKTGQRPINNVVDITNYVMLEFGQPLHAFDFQHVKGNHITVRPAFENEIFEALDGQRLTLSPPMLVIADDDRTIGLAGIIGGANTEVTDKTSEIFLEAATFDGYNNRITTGILKLRTDASIRFAKGLNPSLADRGLQRAVDLISEYCEGSTLEAIGDACSESISLVPHEITLSSKKIWQVLGVNYALSQARNVLSSLGCDIAETSSGDAFELKIQVPYWRTDLAIENDLIEELARVTGYDSIPTAPPSGNIPYPLTQPLYQLSEKIKDLMIATGSQEIVSYSLVSEEMLRKVFSFESTNPPLHLANPMSSEQEYLRNTLSGSILENLRHNQRYQSAGLKLFEIGRTYHGNQTDLPEEKETLSAIVAGSTSKKSWIDQRAEVSVMGFYDAKGIVEFLLSELKLPTQYVPTTDPLFVTGKTATIQIRNTTVGIIGEIKQSVLAQFDIAIPNVAMFELNIGKILTLSNLNRTPYRSLSKFPEALRDIALLVDKAIPSDRISNLIAKHKLVTKVELFDIYIGRASDETKKSLAFHVTYQSLASTLSAEEINHAQDQILAVLADKVGAQLRRQ